MYLYLIEGIRSKKLYIGVTNDVTRRLSEHNKGSKHFTGRLRESWKLIAYKKFPSKEFAQKEELRLKKARNKKYIKWYFDNLTP